MVAETPSLIEGLESLDPSETGAKKRGRPKMSDEAKKEARNARDRARRGSTGGARKAVAAPRTRAPRSLYPEIAGFLTMTNTAVAMTPLGSRFEAVPGEFETVTFPGMAPMSFPKTRMVKLGDELDELEVAMLARSIDAQCERSPRFKRYVKMVLGVGAAGGMITVVGIIAGRRAARHGLIDPSVDARLGAMLSGDISALASFTDKSDEPPVNADTGETAPRATPDLDDDAQPRNFDEL